MPLRPEPDVRVEVLLRASLECEAQREHAPSAQRGNARQRGREEVASEARGWQGGRFLHDRDEAQAQGDAEGGGGGGGGGGTAELS